MLALKSVQVIESIGEWKVEYVIVSSHFGSLKYGKETLITILESKFSAESYDEVTHNRLLHFLAVKSYLQTFNIKAEPVGDEYGFDEYLWLGLPQAALAVFGFDITICGK